LILLGTDAGAALAREVEHLGGDARVPVLSIGTRVLLGKATGRAQVAVAAFTDAGLAEAAKRAAQNQSFVRRKV
jgi:ribosomal protein L7Ae-like RNA K-turn-binding protein